MDYIKDLIEFFSNSSINDVPADIDTLGAMLEIKGNNRAVGEILDFYLQSSINTRLTPGYRNPEVAAVRGRTGAGFRRHSGRKSETG